MTATIVYDGDCAFCTSGVRWVPRLRLGADEIVAWQFADLDSLGLTEKECDESAWLVVDGRRWSGATAAAHLLLRSPWYWRPLGVLLLTPPFSWLARRGYRWIANNRDRMPGGTPACALPTEERPRAG